MADEPSSDNSRGVTAMIIVGFLSLGVFVSFAIMPQHGGLPNNPLFGFIDELLFGRPMIRPTPGLHDVRTLALAMFQYSCDHDNKYPTGKSSTEVFQKLIDEGYVSDPSIFFCADLKIPGKAPAASNAKLLISENVCWDVTIPVDTNSSDFLPLVFSTGYKVVYAPGGSAVPLFKPGDGCQPGVCVCYHSNSAEYIPNDGLADRIIPNFISMSFAPAGKTYQQLTPDGPLPP